MPALTRGLRAHSGTSAASIPRIVRTHQRRAMFWLEWLDTKAITKHELVDLIAKLLSPAIRRRPLSRPSECVSEGFITVALDASGFPPNRPPIGWPRDDET